MLQVFQLISYYHSQGFKTTPRYVLLETIDEKPKKKYVIGAYDPNNNLIGTGTSNAKIPAAQIAAHNALIKLNALNVNKKKIEEESDEIYSFE